MSLTKAKGYYQGDFCNRTGTCGGSWCYLIHAVSSLPMLFYSLSEPDWARIVKSRYLLVYVRWERWKSSLVSRCPKCDTHVSVRLTRADLDFECMFRKPVYPLLYECDQRGTSHRSVIMWDIATCNFGVSPCLPRVVSSTWWRLRIDQTISSSASLCFRMLNELPIYLWDRKRKPGGK